MRCVRWFRASERDVTKPEPGDVFLAPIPVEAILAYEATDVPTPVRLWGVAPVEVEFTKVFKDGEWQAL